MRETHRLHSSPAAAADRVLIACLLVAGHAAAADTPAKVDAIRLNQPDRDGANWLSYGPTYGAQRFSPLAKITAVSAPQLGLTWYAELYTRRGQLAMQMK